MSVLTPDLLSRIRARAAGYDRDNAWYKAWDAIARERDSFLAWMDENVLRSGPEAFARHAGARA